MPTSVSLAIVAALAVTALWGMRVGWRHRGERTSAAVPGLPAVPAPDDSALGRPVTGPLEATYVSSTVAGDWLERVVAQDLGVRSAAVVQVFDAGVRIEREGAPDLFVPAAAVRAAGTSAGMAGKYVGGQGLVVLTWQPPAPGAATLDTGLRMRRAADREPLLAAVRALEARHQEDEVREEDGPRDQDDRTDPGAPGADERETA